MGRQCSIPLEHLIKGMFLKRPVIRVLSPPWNMQTVLETLAKPPFEPLEVAPLNELSLKMAFLLSAASARRRSALYALSLKEGHIRFESGSVRLVPDPSFLTKNQTLDFLPESIFLPSLSTLSDTRENRVWCPVRCLLAYIKRTQNLRGMIKRFFISFQKPHHRVSRDTISHWITQAIVYIFANKAHAHQVRAVSTSIALFAGVPLGEIMRAAVWKTPSTFVRLIFEICIWKRATWPELCFVLDDDVVAVGMKRNHLFGESFSVVPLDYYVDLLNIYV